MTSPRSVRWTFIGIACWLVLAQLRVLFTPGLDVGPVFDRYAHCAVLALAGVLCVLRAVRNREERAAWALIGAGVLAWTFGDTYYATVLWTVEVVPIPSPADVGFLLMAPLVIAGVLLLLRSRLPDVPAILRVDGIAASLAVAAVSAAIVADTAIETVSGKPLGIAVTLAYPSFDLVLVACVVGAVAGTGWRLDRSWTLMLAGVMAFWVADTFYLVQTAKDVYESESWFDIGWWAGLVLMCLAAWQTPPPVTGEAPERGIRLIVMPLAFGAIGLALLIYGAFADLSPVAVVLAAASLTAVGARLIITFRENTQMLQLSRDEALTDALTGLPNRRALVRHLERAMPLASDEAPLVLALLDLDGFKSYNDTFGHPAGDAMLVRLGSKLRGSLIGHGEAFRMGGDEFCAVFEPGTEAVVDVVARAAEALSEIGSGFALTCSHGSILLPREATSVTDALRIADQRMYAQKHVERVAATR